MYTDDIACQIVDRLYLVIVLFYDNILICVTIWIGKLHALRTVLSHGDCCKRQISLTIFQIHRKGIKCDIDYFQIYTETICDVLCDIHVHTDHIFTFHIFKRRPCSVSCHDQLSSLLDVIQSVIGCHCRRACHHAKYHRNRDTSRNQLFHNFSSLVAFPVYLCDRL